MARRSVRPAQASIHCVLRVKRPGIKADHSPHPSSSEVRNEWSHTYTPRCPHGMHRDSAVLIDFVRFVASLMLVWEGKRRGLLSH